jgi:hypothetical protein
MRFWPLRPGQKVELHHGLLGVFSREDMDELWDDLDIGIREHFTVDGTIRSFVSNAGGFRG